ncbi:hypothetical protein [Vulcanisaeta sp. JCM 14467]
MYQPWASARTLTNKAIIIFKELTDISEYGGLAGLFDEVVREYGRSFYRRVDMPFNNGKEFINRNRDTIIRKLQELGDTRQLITIDGVKVIFNDNS